MEENDFNDNLPDIVSLADVFAGKPLKTHRGEVVAALPECAVIMQWVAKRPQSPRNGHVYAAALELVNVALFDIEKNIMGFRPRGRILWGGFYGAVPRRALKAIADIDAAIDAIERRAPAMAIGGPLDVIADTLAIIKPWCDRHAEGGRHDC